MVIVHGLGCSTYSFREIVKIVGSSGIRAVAMDLPGSGFSEKSVIEEGGSWGGVFGRFWDVYSDIKEHGLFWGFDHLIENGYVPYEKNEDIASSRKIVKPIELGPQEMGRVLGQVIDSMGLAPVHLVLHDSALGMSANWVSENSRSVRSVTLIDSAPRGAALAWWVLDVPVARELLLGVSVLYAKFFNMFCSKLAGFPAAEAHRVLLKGRYGRQAVVGMAKKMNYSFDLEAWGGLEGIKGVPIQVLWSSSWSKQWSEEGRQVANALPQANFVFHSGGRWPQEDVADELAGRIVQFVSSLPAITRQVEEDPQPKHTHQMFEEATMGDDHYHLSGRDQYDGLARGHGHAPGFMDAYGLSH